MSESKRDEANPPTTTAAQRSAAQRSAVAAPGGASEPEQPTRTHVLTGHLWNVAVALGMAAAGMRALMGHVSWLATALLRVGLVLAVGCVAINFAIALRLRLAQPWSAAKVRGLIGDLCVMAVVIVFAVAVARAWNTENWN